MGIYTEIIIKKEENNRRLEQYADDSLKLDVEMHRLENSVDDAETALLFILNRFGLTVRRVFCQTSIDEMLETLLDPLGMMYDYEDSVAESDSDSNFAFFLHFSDTDIIARVIQAADLLQDHSLKSLKRDAIYLTGLLKSGSL